MKVYRVVYCCTIHFKILDRGVWKTSLWSETMAQRHQLILHEGVCNSCFSDARRILREQLAQRERGYEMYPRVSLDSSVDYDGVRTAMLRSG